MREKIHKLEFVLITPISGFSKETEEVLVALPT